MNPTGQSSNLSNSPSTAEMLSQPTLRVLPTPKQQAEIDRALDVLCRLALQRAMEIIACQEQQSTAG